MAFRIEDISFLSPEMQKQVIEKLAKRKQKNTQDTIFNSAGKKSKYGNVKSESHGISFDSKKEARRFEELSAMELAGEISDLRLQVDFTLQEAYTKSDGERVRAIRYKADFTYRDKNGDLVVEDVKSKATRTKTYLIKRKLMQEKFNIDIQEI